MSKTVSVKEPLESLFILNPTVGTMCKDFAFSGFNWFIIVDFPLLSKPTHKMFACFFLNWNKDFVENKLFKRRKSVKKKFGNTGLQ